MFVLRLLLALFPVVCIAQPYFNLDFETAPRGRLRSWFFGTPGFEASVDTSTKVSGEQSYRIRNVAAPDNGLGVASQLFPIDLARGKTIRFSGWMKTEGVSGYSALWLRVDGPNGSLSLDNMSAFGPRGTTDWAPFEFTRAINPAGIQIVFGVFLSGRGTAWFDNLQIEIDGQPVVQNPPFSGEPSEEQLSWMRRSSIPFRTADAGGSAEDLAPLRGVIGNARVVGLGEATHGTSEFFRMKHRLLEYLATNMGFTLFSIEANMPESYRVNDYVLTGRGDPKTLLKGMYFWTWNTQEVLDMIEWMRQFNASGKGRVQFTGYDMQTWTVAGSIVLPFLQANEPGYYPTAQAAYALVSQTRSLAVNAANLPRLLEAANAAKDVRLHMEQNFDAYRRNATLAEADWAVQNARVVEMAAYSPVGGTLHRDEMMALNTWWILEHNPGAKAVLWAHNYHVSRVAGAMGSHLDKWLGSDYRVLGFAFHSGRYNAWRTSPTGAITTLGDNVAVESYPGSVEYMFHSTGMPRFILDLRLAKADNPGSWLLGEMDFREIGSVSNDGFGVRSAITRDYDALIFFDQTTPSVLLPF